MVAPLGRDARLVTDRLRAGGLAARACDSLDALCDGLESGFFGAALLTSEALGGAGAARLGSWLCHQPSWSDLPVILLADVRRPRRDARRQLGASAVVLERPVPSSALLAAVRLALSDRRRQLEVSGLLHALEGARAELEARVAARTREVRRLAADLTLAEHSERRRIAHLLHDDLQQRLHGLLVTLALLRRVLPSDPDLAARLLEQAGETLGSAAELTRSLSHDLAPPILRGDGLAELLEWTAAHAHERYGLTVELAVEDGVAIPREDVRVLLSQALNELLFNAVKHAGVDRVQITAQAALAAPAVRVTVADEGRGFDVDASRTSTGVGLTSVRERAELVGGSLTVESAPGRGTRATLQMPTSDPGPARGVPAADGAAAR